MSLEPVYDLVLKTENIGMRKKYASDITREKFGKRAVIPS